MLYGKYHHLFFDSEGWESKNTFAHRMKHSINPTSTFETLLICILRYGSYKWIDNTIECTSSFFSITLKQSSNDFFIVYENTKNIV